VNLYERNCMCEIDFLVSCVSLFPRVSMVCVCVCVCVRVGVGERAIMMVFGCLRVFL